MGQLEIYNTLKNINSNPKVEDFKIISLLGRGGFSTVKKVKYYNPYIISKGNNEEFLAMKQMSKKRIIELNCIENIFHERDILLNLYNNNIINIYCTFQDKNNIYMIMDYLAGKDLRNLMKNNKNRKFKENEIIFFAACIILGLEYIHSNNIIHRDIKPENLLFDSKFFLRIGDFGVAVKKSWNFKNDNIGTLSYMAPERIGFFQDENKNNYKYSFESDFYSLGIVLYELCMKKKPFESCKSGKEMIENFTKIKNFKIISEYYSQNLCDLINQLLIFDPTKRIGYNNIVEIKTHLVFESFHWKNLTYRTMKSPILEENNDIILKTKENILLNNSEEYKDDSFEINEQIQEKFKDYSCIHKLNISDIMGPKIILRNNKKASSLTTKSQKKIKILKEMKSFDNNIYLSEKKIINSNNYNKNEITNDKKINLRKNLFNSKFILPKLERKIIKNISNINLNMRYKFEENAKSNSLLIKEDNLNDCIYNNKKTISLVIKNNNNIRRKHKLNNAPFLKRESSKLKNIFQI